MFRVTSTCAALSSALREVIMRVNGLVSQMWLYWISRWHILDWSCALDSRRKGSLLFIDPGSGSVWHRNFYLTLGFNSNPFHSDLQNLPSFRSTKWTLHALWRIWIRSKKLLPSLFPSQSLSLCLFNFNTLKKWNCYPRQKLRVVEMH